MSRPERQLPEGDGAVASAENLTFSTRSRAPLPTPNRSFTLRVESSLHLFAITSDQRKLSL